MYEIHASVTIDAPPQQVFESVTDHEAFLSGPNTTCRLTKEGTEQRTGAGAVREVTADGSVFTEEITAFDPPRHMEYVVRSLVDTQGRPVRMQHLRGWLDFTLEGDGTRVDWYSRFKITIPVVGWFVERVVGPRATVSFQRLLERTKTELEAIASGQ